MQRSQRTGWPRACGQLYHAASALIQGKTGARWAGCNRRHGTGDRKRTLRPARLPALRAPSAARNRRPCTTGSNAARCPTAARWPGLEARGLAGRRRTGRPAPRNAEFLAAAGLARGRHRAGALQRRDQRAAAGRRRRRPGAAGGRPRRHLGPLPCGRRRDGSAAARHRHPADRRRCRPVAGEPVRPRALPGAERPRSCASATGGRCSWTSNGPVLASGCQLTHHDVMLEAAATSFQVHLQMPSAQAVRVYNAALLASAPALALAGQLAVPVRAPRCGTRHASRCSSRRWRSARAIDGRPRPCAARRLRLRLRRLVAARVFPREPGPFRAAAAARARRSPATRCRTCGCTTAPSGAGTGRCSASTPTAGRTCASSTGRCRPARPAST